jgi:PadR family transcriptional regulator, regulatory protein PadR
LDIVTGNFLAALEELELDQKSKAGDLASERLDQSGDGRRIRPPGNLAPLTQPALARSFHAFIPVDFLQKLGNTSCWISRGAFMTGGKEDILRGTLDLLVLKTLDTLGPLHGYGVARRIEQVSENLLHLNQGTLYPALLRLEQKGWISSKWGTSDNHRRARYYALTKAGRKQLAREAESWERMAGMIGRLLEGTEG